MGTVTLGRYLWHWVSQSGLLQYADANDYSQIIGQLFTAWVADRWGRRVSLYFTLCCVYIGVAAEMASQSHNDYTGAKLIMGFASGGLQAAVSTFVSEVAPRELRGFFIGMSAFERKLPVSLLTITFAN